MKRLLNTVYVAQPEAYLSLDGGNLRITADHQVLGEVPLINLEGIVTFGRSGASPALIQECLERSIQISFMSASGRFMGQVIGELNGNVLLRRQQYRIADNEETSLAIARNFIIGKIYNQRWIIDRAIRDHAMVVDVAALRATNQRLAQRLTVIRDTTTLDSLRGEEGNAAAEYYGVFDHLILQHERGFSFSGRTRRPPLDPVNALLSFSYSLLANECAAALTTVGLDPFVGFMHQDRPGRRSLALDLMEEFRGVSADRFVLKLINKRIFTPKDFVVRENQAVRLTDESRREFISQWQSRKQESLTHPFLGEKINWGLLPYVQALLLARYIRGDLDAYPPFLWK